MASLASINQNVDAINICQGHIEWSVADGDGGAAGPIKTANTAKDGTGTVNTVFTGAVNGSGVRKIRFNAAGTNVASVARIFINNGGAHATPANNILWREISLPATTLTEVAQQLETVLFCDLVLPAGYKLLVVIGTTVSAGWFAIVEAGDY